jgi:hypothetical protein
MNRLFKWIAKNERHISTAVFLGGFILDNLAYERIDLPWVNLLFAGFLVAAALCIIMNHVMRREKPDAAPSTQHPSYTLLPIAAQFFLGGLLSGCVIFYTRSANFGVSWPFLLLLFAVFVGNEALQKYRERLAFQVVLFFFTLYAYAVFALPIARGKMSSLIFVESGVVSVVIFGLFLGILWFVSKERLKESLRRILVTTGVIFVLVNFFYFVGLLPPLPLALKDAGIYHSMVKTGTGYSVQAEEDTWNPLSPQVLHVVSGEPLYAYSAVFAPVSLSTPVVHRWQKYNDSTHDWDTVAAIAFPISGGRDKGYRGYSILTSVSVGEWRVSIETLNGAVLGRERFDVQMVKVAPTVHTEYK